jgi:hypothetical protein
VLVLTFLSFAPGTFSQVVISDNPSATADPAAILDLQSSDRGMLFPRMTEAQKNVISNPPTGLVVYQTDGTTGLYYNFGTPAAPQWNKVTDNTTPQGYWSQNSVGIYFDSGDVGIGTLHPDARLHVDGASHLINDSVYISGRPGKLFIDAETGYEPTLRFGYDGTAIYRLRYRMADASIGDPYFMLNSNLSDNIWGVSSFGRVRQSYIGSSQAYLLYSSAAASALWIQNNNANDGARAINAAVSDASASENTLAIGGWNMGEGDGVYGENNTEGNFGYLGTNSFGAYGEHGGTGNRGHLGGSLAGAYGRAGLNTHWGALGIDGAGDYGVYGDDGNTTNPNFGGIGTSNYGVYGEYGAEEFWGALGSSTSGVYGRLGGSSQSLTPGDYAVKGIGVENASQAGTDYTYNNTIGGVMGYNVEGVAYSFGVAGYTETNPANRAGGVLGAFYDANQWGSLAYENSSGTRYGGYFTNTTTGNGKSQAGQSSSIGIGVYGDLFGAHVHGNVYGLYAEGVDYGIYANGDVYRTGADVHLQTDMNGQNNVMYTLVSPEMTVQTYGIGQMQNGKSNIAFDAVFASMVSSAEPIIVTITPIGESKGVYLDRVDDKGFVVAENNNGKSNVQFSWIAIGKRQGYENMSLPADVTAGDYTSRVNRGLHNDSDIATDGEGLYYQDGRLVIGNAAGPLTGRTTTGANSGLNAEERMPRIDPSMRSLDKKQKSMIDHEVPATDNVLKK